MRQKSIRQLMFLGLISLFFILGGCASGVSNSVKVSDDDIAKYQVMTSAEAVDSLASEIEAAGREKLPFYTPKHYEEAKKLYDKVSKALEKNKKKKDIIRDVAKADRLLAAARIKKLDVISELGDLFAVNESLVKLQAPKIYKKAYNGLYEKLMSLIVKIEEGKAEKTTKDKNSLLKAFGSLEVKSIKYAALHEANQINQQAKAKKALKLAPKTYAESIKVYQASDANISQNPYDEGSVAGAKKLALFAANHALNVTEQVIQLGVRFKSSPEQVVLDEENRILEVSDAVDQLDRRDLLIDEQVAGLVASVAQLKSKSDKSEQLAEDNDQYAKETLDLKAQLKTHKAASDLTKKTLEEIKAELVDRDSLVVKMTADLLASQQKEKELTALIVQQNEASRVEKELKTQPEVVVDLVKNEVADVLKVEAPKAEVAEKEVETEVVEKVLEAAVVKTAVKAKQVEE